MNADRLVPCKAICKHCVNKFAAACTAVSCWSSVAWATTQHAARHTGEKMQQLVHKVLHLCKMLGYWVVIAVGGFLSGALCSDVIGCKYVATQMHSSLLPNMTHRDKLLKIKQEVRVRCRLDERIRHSSFEYIFLNIGAEHIQLLTFLYQKNTSDCLLTSKAQH